ncbi:hypothetical protein FJV83_35915 [Mesorhizobium sp. WSM4307]|nr:hypothetical protein FJV81_26205 [Mesorhizobium sp. WSM4315]TRC74714.1 hypothetical protein FJV83_35915 [Mesorhizobium sp. WSM4307]
MSAWTWRAKPRSFSISPPDPAEAGSENCRCRPRLRAVSIDPSAVLRSKRTALFSFENPVKPTCWKDAPPAARPRRGLSRGRVGVRPGGRGGRGGFLTGLEVRGEAPGRPSWRT